MELLSPPLEPVSGDWPEADEWVSPPLRLWAVGPLMQANVAQASECTPTNNSASTSQAEPTFHYLSAVEACTNLTSASWTALQDLAALHQRSISYFSDRRVD